MQIFWSVLLFLHPSLFSQVQAESSSSLFNIDGTAQFNFVNPLTSYSGSMRCGCHATVLGNSVGLLSGRYSNQEALFQLTGNVEFTQPYPTASMNGNDRLQGSPGAIIQTLLVNNAGNRLEGTVTVETGIYLADRAASLYCNMLAALESDIYLNKGTVYLLADLDFKEAHRFIGPGTVQGQRYRISFGEADSIVWNEALLFVDCRTIDIQSDQLSLNASWTICGDTVIDAHGQVIQFEDYGSLVVADKAYVTIRNAVLKGAKAGSLVMTTTASTLELFNVTIELTDDMTLETGSLIVKGNNIIRGAATFLYASSLPLQIKQISQLSIQNGLVFHYAPSNQSPNMVAFADGTACLQCGNATLQVDACDLNLAGGRLDITGALSLIGQSSGIIQFGSGNTGEDLMVRCHAGGSIKIQQGELLYNNVNLSSWINDVTSNKLIIMPGSSLMLNQALKFEFGAVQYYQGSTLAFADSTIQLQASVESMRL